MAVSLHLTYRRFSNILEKYNFIENQEIVRLRADGMQFYTIDEEEITKEPVTIGVGC